MSKNIIVTGANRGIGRELVKELANRGNNIWACIRKENQEFDDYVNRIAEENSVWIKVIAFDLQSDEEIKTAIKAIISEGLSIDGLVNNAGINHYGLVAMTTIQEAKKIFQIDYFAPLLISQLVLRKMSRQKSGVIVNVASIAGLDSHAGDGIYGSAKAALISLTRVLSTEVAKIGIRVNGVAPGPTDTEMIAQHIEKLGEDVVSSSAMGRLATKAEIVNVIIFLLSEQSSFVNGQVIRVDGGII